MPRYHSALAAGIDLHACLDEPLALEPGAPAALVSAGIAIHIADPQLVGLIVPRSGLGHRSGVVMGNLVGVVDADYIGPLMVSLWNRNAPDTAAVTIAPGDRIAQLLFVPIVRPVFNVVETFSLGSERGGAGFGSTGQGVAALNPS